MQFDDDLKNCGFRNGDTENFNGIVGCARLVRCILFSYVGMTKTRYPGGGDFDIFIDDDENATAYVLRS